MEQLDQMFQNYQRLFRDPSVLGTFSDNHDNPRFLSLITDTALYQSALTYVLTSLGIPIIYYGTEQGFHGANDPYCREPLWPTQYRTGGVYYTTISTLNQYRQTVQLGLEKQVNVYVADNAFAFTRGNSTLVVLTQVGSQGPRQTVPIQKLSLPTGTVLANVFNTQDKITVQEGGSVTVELDAGQPKVYTTHSMYTMAQGPRLVASQ